MKISEVKDLMHEFDDSSLREFSWSNATDKLSFSKNQTHHNASSPTLSLVQPAEIEAVIETESSAAKAESQPEKTEAEGECVKSPLVGVVYTKPAPDKADFIQVGDTVKEGQTLLIIEAMKVMNEIPAPKSGRITEILVKSEEVVEFGQELVRIKM
ncbi:MAG: acetyl-CoA carboxylase biotin carboxyl carrier protein [Streptococcaceae bacterium]|jgi:acetyl-CoA carboxylase biotin carboxyl carrier protein|nr:acetyl-CoA carboxylase biotin carboxyl carrier protein [Streptococcaceae bacterium]